MVIKPLKRMANENVGECRWFDSFTDIARHKKAPGAMMIFNNLEYYFSTRITICYCTLIPGQGKNGSNKLSILNSFYKRTNNCSNKLSIVGTVQSRTENHWQKPSIGNLLP